MVHSAPNSMSGAVKILCLTLVSLKVVLALPAKQVDQYRPKHHLT
jgi:hypothetical protein